MTDPIEQRRLREKFVETEPHRAFTVYDEEGFEVDPLTGERKDGGQRLDPDTGEDLDDET